MALNIREAIERNDFLLTEAAVIESLRRLGDIELHPLLVNAPLVYDEKGREALSGLYRSFVSIAHSADIPIILAAPTWRANRERIEASHVGKDVNGDAVRFLKGLRGEWGSWAENIYVGGLVGCKNDCYKPEEGLSREEAGEFHVWQVDELASAGVDYFLAVTLPALPEAVGIALAMARTNIPYIVSFVISREGRILDGTGLERAFAEIDATAGNPPLGYMINCSYPSFLRAHEQPEPVMSRIIGYQANASSLDQTELDGSENLEAEDVSEWGELMIDLNKRYGIKILGGCCGTSTEHLEYIVMNI